MKKLSYINRDNSLLFFLKLIIMNNKIKKEKEIGIEIIPSFNISLNNKERKKERKRERERERERDSEIIPSFFINLSLNKKIKKKY